MLKKKLQQIVQNKKSIAELRNLGLKRILPTKKGKGSVVQGLQFLMQFEIIVDERCFKTIEEFDNYTWQKDKDTGGYTNEPVDTYNHCIDSLRYSVERFYRPVRKRTNVSSKVDTIKSLGL